MNEASAAGAELPRLFTDAMSELVSGVAVVTARHPDARPFGLAVTSLSSYSANPPSVMFAVAREARSHQPLLEAPHHGVHLLTADQEEVARTFAGKGDDKFAGLDWEWEADVPAIGGALAFLVCRRTASFDHGDHSIVVGEVREIRLGRGQPLVYGRRQMNWSLTDSGQ